MSHFIRHGFFTCLSQKGADFTNIDIEVKDKITLTIHVVKNGLTTDIIRKTFDAPHKRIADTIFELFPENVHSLQFTYLDEHEHPMCMARLTRRGYWKYYKLKRSLDI
jgi:hypothetical protein